MPTAHEVATELRKLADSLDVQPDAVIPQPNLFFQCSYVSNPKETFVNIARLLPRPIDKKPKGDEYRLEHKTSALNIMAYVNRGEICTVIEPARPAVYDCPSLLSVEEEQALGAF